jgi:hypothetical protein
MHLFRFLQKNVLKRLSPQTDKTDIFCPIYKKKLPPEIVDWQRPYL